MKKTNKWILIVASLLAIIAVVLLVTNKNTTIRKELKDFAVKDTGNVDKIFMVDRSQNKVLLQKREDGKWNVNGKFPARKDAVNNLLYTIASLDVQSPVGTAAYNTVIKDLAAGAIKVEVYVKGDLTKVYYVGGPTANHLGTYMMLENSSTPFIMHIPGFDGYLSTRYFTKEIEWRDKTIFDYKEGEIAEVKISYTGKPEMSFNIDVQNNKLTLKGANNEVIPAQEAALKLYVANFKNIQAMNYANEYDKKDSVFHSTPICSITVTQSNKVKNVVALYPKPNDAGKTDDKGNLYPYDIDMMYAFVNGKDFCVVQNYVFDKLLRQRADFTAKTNANK